MCSFLWIVIFPVEKFKAITDGHEAQDKRAVADARAKLATAFKAKAKSVNEKYIVPPKTTDLQLYMLQLKVCIKN
jgi:DNA recombination protein RmuC